MFRSLQLLNLLNTTDKAYDDSELRVCFFYLVFEFSRGPIYITTTIHWLFQNVTDLSCWDKCRDFKPAELLETVNGLHSKQENLATIVIFKPIRKATFYVVQYRALGDADFAPHQFAITLQPFITNFMGPKSIFCKSTEIRVAAVSPSGIGPFSDIFTLGPPSPVISWRLELDKMVYLNTPLSNDGYFANGTVEITFKYKAGAWPLGIEDLDVIPMFELFRCAVPSFQSVPHPTFVSFGLSEKV
ncbi:unnamed protein product [Strongylus vulgaris]|uniref:Uncharacterized protein n=1 Tax=Strongylus vulgaris TaxID=40348 RepID=A0A3P7LLF0_STRVU|nr:unnamed protein product [Strongylus vulgaris]